MAKTYFMDNGFYIATEEAHAWRKNLLEIIWSDLNFVVSLDAI